MHISHLKIGRPNKLLELSGYFKNLALGAGMYYSAQIVGSRNNA